MANFNLVSRKLLAFKFLLSALCRRFFQIFKLGHTLSSLSFVVYVKRSNSLRSTVAFSKGRENSHLLRRPAGLFLENQLLDRFI